MKPLRLLIVDDNPVVLESLRTSIDWQNLGCDVFTAQGYQSAVTSFAEKPADLLLSDICLPEQDGIALANFLRSFDPELQIIFITGFGELEYAKAAVRLGACDFILKPIDNEELISAIHKAIGKHRQVKESKVNLRTLLHDILSGIVDEQIIWMNQAKEFLGYSPRFLQCIRITSLNHHNPLSNKDCDLPRNIVGLEDERGAMFFCFTEEKPQDKKFVSILQQNLPFDSIGMACIGIGASVLLTETDVDQALQSARTAAETACFFCQEDKLASGTTIILEAENCTDDQSAVLRQLTNQIEIFEQSLGDSEEQTIAAVEAIADLLADGKHCSVQPVKDILKEVIFFLYRSLNALSYFKTNNIDLISAFNAIDDSRVSGDAVEVIRAETKRFFRRREEARTSHYSPAVRMTLEYLQDSFSGHINLADVASRCQLSTGYLSRLLKQETGMSFSVLLNHARIAEAVRLLAKTTMKVYEVAEAVGFENPAYFHQVFRSITGKSPKDYVRKADKMSDLFTFL